LLGLWRPTWTGVNVCANLCLPKIHKVSANDAKETQLTITPTHSNVQHEVSLKIGLPSENVRDKDTSKERMVIQVHLPQIQADAIPRRRFMKVWEQKREPEQCSILVTAESYEIIAFPCARARRRS